MNCDKYLSDLQNLAEEQVDLVDDLEGIEAHLSQCDSCFEKFSATRAAYTFAKEHRAEFLEYYAKKTIGMIGAIFINGNKVAFSIQDNVIQFPSGRLGSEIDLKIVLKDGSEIQERILGAAADTPEHDIYRRKEDGTIIGQVSISCQVYRIAIAEKMLKLIPE